MSESQKNDSSYVLITAACNEENCIEKLILAVLSQVTLPRRWVIVSDGSIDRTDEIVSRYAAEYPFIQLLRMSDSHERDFASKAYALNAAAKLLKDDDYAFIGHLDADVSFSPTYISQVLDRFALDPKLGIGGGVIYESDGGRFKPRPGNRRRSVAGAVQMFRRECCDSLGGMLPLSGGAEDWCAEVGARMNGWRVVAFPELEVYHHRPTGHGGRILQYLYHQGGSDYQIGVHPVFEVFRMAVRLSTKPYVIGALVELWGFAAAHFRREERVVSPEFVRFLQAEQIGRLWPFRRKDDGSLPPVGRRRS